jgi:hypothetical protein
MFKSLLLGIGALVALSTFASAGAPQVIAPSVVASIHDEPVDGLGDSFNATPFEGLIRTQSSRADRAIQEYDVSALTGQSITSATLAGRVAVNNGADNGIRTFDFLLYDGNGGADLGDYQVSANVVGSGQYHPPNDSSFTFQFDVTAEVQALLTGGATFIGLRVEGTSNPNFPNILVAADCHLDINGGSPPQVTYFCSGDGSGTACPCGNSGAAAAGCANSANANGASIGFLGTPSVAGGNFFLTAAGAVPNKPGLFFEGTAQANGGNGMILGDGLLCASGTIKRLEIVFLDGTGAAASSVDIPSLSGVMATQTRHYQFWFRDPSGGPCSTGFNLSNALSATWTP